MDESKLISFLVFFPGFLFSLSVHEAAHGYVANLFGDETAKRLGRVSLNPLPHMDILGTVIFPILGFFAGGLIFGWGKPVPVDYRNLKNWKRDGLYIAAAGPVSNLILAFILAGVVHLVVNTSPEWADPNINYKNYLIFTGLLQALMLNLALFFFNLIPVHPLDGGKILYGLLPQPYADQFDHFFARFGFILLIFLFISGLLRYVVGVPVYTVARWLLPF